MSTSSKNCKEAWRCKISVLPQFCVSFDVFSCGVLPESGRVGISVETLFTMGKGLKSSNVVTPDDSARNRKMRKIMSLNCSIFLMPIFGLSIQNLDFQRRSSPVEHVDVLVILPAFCGFMVSGKKFFEAAGCVPSVMSQPKNRIAIWSAPAIKMKIENSCEMALSKAKSGSAWQSHFWQCGTLRPA